MLLRAANQMGTLEVAEFQKTLAKLILFYLNIECDNNILTSKKINKSTFIEHLERKREMKSYFLARFRGWKKLIDYFYYVFIFLINIKQSNWINRDKKKTKTKIYPLILSNIICKMFKRLLTFHPLLMIKKSEINRRWTSKT